MSTTTCAVPTRSTSSSANRSLPVSRCRAFFDDQRFAEDARRFGQRHRQVALHRRAVRELRVVIRVTQLVGGGLRRVEAAAPVQEHQRTIAGEWHAEGAALLARARSGVDPLLVERAIDQPVQSAAVGLERVAHDLDAVVPRDRCGTERQAVRPCRTTAARRRARASRAFDRIQPRRSGSESVIAACIASNVGAADAVREQRRVKW